MQWWEKIFDKATGAFTAWTDYELGKYEIDQNNSGLISPANASAPSVSGSFGVSPEILLFGALAVAAIFLIKKKI